MIESSVSGKKSLCVYMLKKPHFFQHPWSGVMSSGVMSVRHFSYSALKLRLTLWCGRVAMQFCCVNLIIPLFRVNSGSRSAECHVASFTSSHTHTFYLIVHSHCLCTLAPICLLLLLDPCFNYSHYWNSLCLSVTLPLIFLVWFSYFSNPTCPFHTVFYSLLVMTGHVIQSTEPSEAERGLYWWIISDVVGRAFNVNFSATRKNHNDTNFTIRDCRKEETL